MLAEPELRAGLLVHPFGPVIAGETYPVVATPEAMARAEVRAVHDWLQDVFR